MIEAVLGTDLTLKAAGALSGRAILVREGQIVLARLIHPPCLVYALRLIEQEGTTDWGRIRIEYIEIDPHRGRE